MTELPIMPDGLDKADYWFVQVSGDEWMFVVRKLIEKHFANAKEPDHAVILAALDGVPLFLLRKSFITSEVLSKASGILAEQIEKAEILRLIIRKPEGLPEPTVSYWGTA